MSTVDTGNHPFLRFCGWTRRWRAPARAGTAATARSKRRATPFQGHRPSNPASFRSFCAPLDSNRPLCSYPALWALTLWTRRDSPDVLEVVVDEPHRPEARRDAVAADADPLTDDPVRLWVDLG